MSGNKWQAKVEVPEERGFLAVGVTLPSLWRVSEGEAAESPQIRDRLLLSATGVQAGLGSGLVTLQRNVLTGWPDPNTQCQGHRAETNLSCHSPVGHQVSLGIEEAQPLLLIAGRATSRMVLIDGWLNESWMAELHQAPVAIIMRGR